MRVQRVLVAKGRAVNKKRRKLMDDLAAARPPLPADVEGWGDSEDARRILRKIVSGGPPKNAAKRDRSGRFNVRSVYLALAVIVIGLAGFLAFELWGGNGQEKIVSQPTTTASTLEAEEAVTIEEALEQIIALAKATPAVKWGQIPGPPGQSLSLQQQAIAFNLIHNAEGEGLQLQRPVMRRQFALWLWRCLGAVLPQGSATATVSDLETLTAEERQAVQDLVRNGVIELGSDGAFHGDNRITPGEESAVLGRVKALLQ